MSATLPVVMMASGSRLAASTSTVRQSPRTSSVRRARAATATASAGGGDSGVKKVVVITGANTGLGFIAAREIAATPGYKVVMACRDLARGEAAAAEVLAQMGAAVDVLKLDLASLSAVDDFVAEFTARYARCDVLMNNAGVLALPQRTLTEDGLEMQMGVNHFGHFYLTSKMLPMILDTPGRPRIVTLTSVAHEFGFVDFENVNSEGFFGYPGAGTPAAGWLTYSRSKLANMYFTYELHRRLRQMGGRGNEIDVNCVHPGLVDTDIQRNLQFDFWPLLRSAGMLVSPEEGARGQVEAAVGPAFEGVSGKYFAEQSTKNPGKEKGTFKIAESSPQSYNQEAAARLWERSEVMTGAVWEWRA
eukprot:CAMPEP_0197591730 /NCGR_PEP_ID=MMETSP1326-20131121/13881_1 /TAXON_ID=1155430 /ORGANISM="Genus nov. species nov., Strain RCC2288" /LENGTH=360 /DNA_ID=CAMNT_0043157277 /DNA_START=156 /DNA_END=1235 /DNA_ORIENTATION=-